MTEPQAIRSVEIRPPSALRETVVVLKMAFHILFWSAFVIFGRAAPDDASAAAESPFDVRFQDLDAADQRLFRALQEGVVEAEAVRGRTKQWPTPAELAAQAIPPFAPDPIDKAGYVWRSLSRGGIVNYIGTPRSESGRRELLVIITEPAPGTESDPNAQVDEGHHRLSNGMMVHVTAYLGPGLGDVREPVAVVSAEAGWRHVTTATR